MRVMIAGGGTGGHVYPGIAMYEALRRRVRNVEVLFVGARAGVENRIFDDLGLPSVLLPGRGVRGKGVFAKVISPLTLLVGLFHGIREVLAFKPDVVIGTGGYASVAVVAASVLCNKKRVLQEQKFQRLGSSRTVSVNVRVIAATHKDLEWEIKEGRFRQDLFFLLNVIPIEVPSLRDRKEDIPVLASIFLEQHARQNNTASKRLSGAALDLLCDYTWPGNVRELKNLMERLTIMLHKETISAEDLPRPYNPDKAAPSLPMADLFAPTDLKHARTRFEEAYIRFILRQHDEDVVKAARAIGVDRGYLRKKRTKITRPQSRTMPPAMLMGSPGWTSSQLARMKASRTSPA